MREANCLREQYFKYSIAGERFYVWEDVVVNIFHPQAIMLMEI